MKVPAAQVAEVGGDFRASFRMFSFADGCVVTKLHFLVAG